SIKVEYARMEYSALLQSRPHRTVQPVLKEQLAAPLHHVREQIPVEGRVLGQQGVEIQLAPGRDQLIQPNLPWRDLRPTARRASVVGIRASVPNPLEDHPNSLPFCGLLLPVGGALSSATCHPVSPACCAARRIGAAV